MRLVGILLFIGGLGQLIFSSCLLAQNNRLSYTAVLFVVSLWLSCLFPIFAGIGFLSIAKKLDKIADDMEVMKKRGHTDEKSDEENEKSGIATLK